MLNVTKAKYDGVKYAVILSLFLFSIGHAQSISKDRALGWSPSMANPQTESFSAIYYEWNDNHDKSKSVDTLSLVRIDSNGKLFTIQSLDPSLRMQRFTILNDTLLLSECCGDYGNTTISVYNALTHSIKKLLDKSIITAVSSDHQYFACQRDNIASPSTIYQVKNGEIFEKIKTPCHIHSAFGRNSFVAFDSILARTGKSLPSRAFDYAIIRSDGSIRDTIPKEVGFSVQQGKNDRELIYISGGQYNYRGDTNTLIAYNSDNKLKDVLFSGLIFDNVFPIPNTDYYLLKGLSQKEWHEQWDSVIQYTRQKYPEGVIDYDFTPKGYWMIGDSKTKKIKKLEFKDFYPIPSASGRHILFYKQDSDDYQIKVASLKDLVERMDK